MKVRTVSRRAGLALALSVGLSTAAGAVVLYGAQGSGNLSDLVVIDPATGAVVQTIGPIGFSVTGLAVEPSTGTLFGTTASNDASLDNLLRIDATTGAGAIIGPGGLGVTASIADIAFAADGTLYGWQEAILDDLVTIDLLTGAATVVGDSGLNTYGVGLGVDGAGTIYVLGHDNGAGIDLHTVDPATGAPSLIGPTALGGPSGFGAMAIHPITGVAYVGDRLFGGGTADLATIDLATAGTTTIGPTLTSLDALAFGPECGDSFVSPNETCDDGNAVPFDGCDASCQLECGNGTTEPQEACDDGNMTDGDGCSADCSAVTYCLPTPDPTCAIAAKASLSIVEKKAGKEKLKAKLQKFDESTTQGDLGDPVGGSTAYDVCVFDQGGARVANLLVDQAGALCGTKQKPCWKAKSTKGYSYKDKDAGEAGVKKIAATSGSTGKGKVQAQAGNNTSKGQTSLPTGLTAALAGDTSASVEVRTSDGRCFTASLGTVKKADTQQFKAKGP